MQIYLFLEGVEQDKVETILKPTSVDIKLHDVQGKNYRCAIPKLNKEIVPAKSKVVVKPTKVIITLFKESKGNWLDLHLKEDKVHLLASSSTFFLYIAVPCLIMDQLSLIIVCISQIIDLIIHALQLKPNLDKGKDPMAGIMDLMKV